MSILIRGDQLLDRHSRQTDTSTDPALYIASSLDNAQRVRSLRDRFRRLGVALTYDWTVHGYVSPDADDGRVSGDEIAGVISARCLLFVAPGRQGSNFEAGIAFARRIPIVLLNDTGLPLTVSFHRRPELIRCQAEQEAVKVVLDIVGQGVVQQQPHIMERYQ